MFTVVTKVYDLCVYILFINAVSGIKSKGNSGISIVMFLCVILKCVIK